jgi:hypothetical protein
MPRVVVWYSDGAASAVAAHLAVQEYGPDRVEVVKCDTTADEHPDNLRFRAEVERWVGKEVVLIQSEKYATVDEVFEKRRYMAGVAGAICTTELKKLPRRAYERPNDIHIFGYTGEEHHRIAAFEANNPELTCDWILSRNFIRKKDCHRILAEAGIAEPAMYALGFEHNNCLGCVKAQSPAYWNRVRALFPDVFERRCRQSRDIGVKLIRLHGERIFLDELPEGAGAGESDGNIECGPYCQMDIFEEETT